MNMDAHLRGEFDDIAGWIFEDFKLGMFDNGEMNEYRKVIDGIDEVVYVKLNDDMSFEVDSDLDGVREKSKIKLLGYVD